MNPKPSHVGTQSDLEDWLSSLGPSVLHFAFSRVKNRSEAEDICQEAFVRAFRSAGKLRDPAKAKTWLLSITANLCHDRMRWWQRQRRHLTPDEPPEVADPVADTEGSVVATEARNRLWHHLLALPSQDRDVLILHHLEDLSVRSVAEVLDCSEAAVKTRLHRARKRLRDALQGEDEYRDG